MNVEQNGVFHNTATANLSNRRHPMKYLSKQSKLNPILFLMAISNRFVTLLFTFFNYLTLICQFLINVKIKKIVIDQNNNEIVVFNQEKQENSEDKSTSDKANGGEDKNSPLNWLADVALKNQDKNESGSDSDSDEEDQEGNFSTLRELLIRPSNKSNGGNGSRSNSPTNCTNSTTNNANNAASNNGSTTAKSSKKSKLDTLDEVQLFSFHIFNLQKSNTFLLYIFIANESLFKFLRCKIFRIQCETNLLNRISIYKKFEKL